MWFSGVTVVLSREIDKVVEYLFMANIVFPNDSNIHFCRFDDGDSHYLTVIFNALPWFNAAANVFTDHLFDGNHLLRHKRYVRFDIVLRKHEVYLLGFGRQSGDFGQRFVSDLGNGDLFSVRQGM